MERVGGELSGVPLGGGEAADRLIDGVYVNQGSLEDRNAVDRLSDSGRGGAGGAATLGVEGGGMDAAVLHEERDAGEIATSSAARGARESTVSSLAKTAVVAQVVLEKLPLHGHRVERGDSAPLAPPSPRTTAPPQTPVRAITHTYMPGGCG